MPIASSVPYQVTDSLGNLICPRDPNRKLLGLRRRLSDFTAAAANTQITELSVPVKIPFGRKIKATITGKFIQHTTAVTNVTLSIWDGTPGSGTQVGGGFTTVPGANYSQPLSVEATLTPDALTKTYNAALGAAATAKIEASATFPLALRIELE